MSRINQALGRLGSLTPCRECSLERFRSFRAPFRIKIGIISPRINILAHEKPRRSDPPGFDGETSALVCLFGGHEGALGAECHGQNAKVFSRVIARRACTLRLAERDRLSGERSIDLRPEHVDCEAEARHRVPVCYSAHAPEVETRIASDAARRDEVLSR